MKLALRSTLLLTFGVLIGVAGITLLRPPVNVLTAERAAFAITPMEAALEKPIPEVWIDNLPLTEAAAKLSAAAGVAIEVDVAAVQEAGVAQDCRIGLRRRNASLTTAMDELVMHLNDVTDSYPDCAWCVSDNRLLISTGDVVARRGTIVVRVYDLARLLPNTPESFGTKMSCYGTELVADDIVEDVCRFIQDTVYPDQWRDVGGSIGSIRAVGYQLVITHSLHAHAEIRRVLRQLVPLMTRSAPEPWLTDEPAAPESFIYHSTLKRWVSMSSERGDERLRAIIPEYHVADVPIESALLKLAEIGKFDLVIASDDPDLGSAGRFPRDTKITLAMRDAPAWRVLKEVLAEAAAQETPVETTSDRRPVPGFGMSGALPEVELTWWVDGSVVEVGRRSQSWTIVARTYDLRPYLDATAGCDTSTPDKWGIRDTIAVNLIAALT